MTTHLKCQFACHRVVLCSVLFLFAMHSLSGCSKNSGADQQANNRSDGSGVTKQATGNQNLDETDENSNEAEIQSLIAKLNGWDKDELHVYEMQQHFPDQKTSGETNGWIGTHKEALEALGIQVRWDAIKREYQVADQSLHVSIEHKEQNEVRVIFANHSKEKSIWLVKAMDGSLVFPYVTPNYSFTVERNGEDLLRQRGWCKVGAGSPYTNTTWPDDYVFEVEPGKTGSVTVTMPFEIPDTDEYKISFEYSFEPLTKTFGSYVYPDQIWKGRAKAETIDVNLKATKKPNTD